MKIHAVVLLVVAALLAPLTMARAEVPYQKVRPVLDATETVMGEKLVQADGSPLHVTSAIVTIDPGEKTGWHKHGVPLYIYILSGEVTVDYGDRGTRAFGTGGAFMEAMDVWHRGTNQGTEPVRILAVYFGSDQASNTIPKD